MKILFVNAYFAPESISFSHLEADLIERLVAAGHTIDVVCPTPTRGITDEVYKAYKSQKNEQLYDGKVVVRRFWAPREGKNPLVRAFRYLWCNLRTGQIGKRYKQTDAVFAVSTPPTQGLIAGRIAKKSNCRLVYSLQDIFPDSLVTTGLAKKDGLLWKIGRRIENDTYRHADHIIVISEGFKRNIMEKGVAADKISVVSNWIDIDTVRPVLRADNALFDEFSLSRDKFTVVYAGNFGEAQGAEVVLDAAERLQDREDIQFAVFGGGARFEDAKHRAEKLPNVFIHDLLPLERVSEVYSLGDVAIITCKAGAGGSAMPSKTWSIMACNTPVIASFDEESDLAEVIQTAGAGVCVEPGNPTALAQAIVTACENKKNSQKTQSDLRAYVAQNADKKTCVGRYIAVLTETASK